MTHQETALPTFTGAEPDLSFPRRLGNYVLRELVVTSSFSRLYRARDPLLDRWVAVKVFHLTPEKEARLPYDRQEWRRRFIVEARILAGLDHPHVVRVDGLGYLPDGTPYMILPWHQANLRREIGRDVYDSQAQAALPVEQRPRPVSPARAVDVLHQVRGGPVRLDSLAAELSYSPVHDHAASALMVTMSGACPGHGDGAV